MIDLQSQGRYRLDLLSFPIVGAILRWKHNRTAAQFVLFGLAAAIIVDGFWGSPLAAKNVATVSAWVHYRGLVVLGLLVAGNLFCAACPFVLPRKLAKWLGRPTQRWPRALRNKWLALAGFVGIIYTYELFDLWASPWWTAWLTLAYFATAFVLEAFFTRNSFCKYVCPLGTFNFLYSTVSPLQISARSQQTCRDCKGHECINGSPSQQGCQLELFVPTLKSNLDCTFCLDCVKACPYDNVALVARPPGDELFRQTWPHRLDLAYLSLLAAFVGLINAVAMTPPIYDLERQMAAWLGTRSEALVLGVIYLVAAIGLPLGAAYSAAWLGNRWNQNKDSLNRLVMRYAYSFVPLGLAIWLAHYLFHFVTGAMTIVPAFQTLFADTLGIPLLGEPDWSIALWFVPSTGSIQITQLVVMAVGTLVSVHMTMRAAHGANPRRRGFWLEALPWLVLLFLLAAAGANTFTLPMEMRGSAIGG
ncbi:MAG: 4Fe-4S binding protein [Caldilineaceae bacterium]|nr:4Fe-4S binding protein [Caldilineaceae bacterium]